MRRRRSSRTFIAVLAMATMFVVLPAAPAAAPPLPPPPPPVLGVACPAGQVQFIVNGGFETGDFTGWSTSATGNSFGFNINDGTYAPSSGRGTLPPISGSFDAVSDQEGPGIAMASEPFIAPPAIASATLSWSDRIENWSIDFVDPLQEFRVWIGNAGGAPLFEVFSTNPGDPLLQPGPNARSFDVTAELQALAGLPAQVIIEQQDSFFFLNATIDDVSLCVDVQFGSPWSKGPASGMCEVLMWLDSATVLRATEEGVNDWRLTGAARFYDSDPTRDREVSLTHVTSFSAEMGETVILEEQWRTDSWAAFRDQVRFDDIAFTLRERDRTGDDVGSFGASPGFLLPCGSTTNYGVVVPVAPMKYRGMHDPDGVPGLVLLEFTVTTVDWGRIRGR